MGLFFPADKLIRANIARKQANTILFFGITIEPYRKHVETSRKSLHLRLLTFLNFKAMRLNFNKTETQISVNIKILNFEVHFILNRSTNQRRNKN